MPISKLSTNYSDRTKDLHIFQGVNGLGFARITPSFGKISNYCTGVQKLVQRYSISLLTELGSQANYPDFGSTLLSALNRGVMNRIDVYPTFNNANIKVIEAFRAYQRANTNLPNDEQLATAVLNNVAVLDGNVGLEIQIYPLTGDAVEFVLPIPSN